MKNAEVVLCPKILIFSQDLIIYTKINVKINFITMQMSVCAQDGYSVQEARREHQIHED